MTTETLERTITSGTSEDEIADDLYDVVKAAIDRGENRDDVLATLQRYYSQLSGPSLEIPRRAVRQVIGCFYGYCEPAAAL